jgi:hypothetical protein
MSSKFLNNAVNPIAISDVIGLQDELDEIQEEIASGGGGGVNFAITSDGVTNGMVFRNNNDLDQIQDTDNFKLVEVLGTKLLSVPDIILPSRLFLSVGDSINANKTKLTQVNYDGTDPQNPITTIQGELDVNKIKNIGHTAEIEFENTGKLLLQCDDDINITTNNSDIKLNSTNSYIGLGNTLDTNTIEISALNEVLIRTHGTGITDDLLLDSGNHIRLSPSRDLLLATGRNTQITSSTGYISLTAANGDITLTANGNVTTTNQPTTDFCIMNKIYTNEAINFAIKYFPAVTTFRLPKNPARPAITDPVYQDEVLKLGWDNPNGNDLEVVFKTGSSNYNSYCYMPGTTSLTKKAIASKNTTIDLNSFSFSGGQMMVANLVPIEAQSTAPKYVITLFFTEDTIGIDGDIDFRIEKFLHQI